MIFSPRALLLGTAACAVAFAVLVLFAYGSGEVRYVDGTAVQSFIGALGASGTTWANRVVQIGDPLPVAVLAGGLAAVAYGRGRPRLAIFVLLLIGATSVGSQVLKQLLAFPREDAAAFIGDAAYPSGHTTAAMALAIGLIVVTPRRARPIAAVAGLALVLGMSYSLIAAGSHFPSDVLGAYLFATGTALCLLAGLQAYESRFIAGTGREAVRHSATRALATPAAAGVLVVFVVAAATAAVAIFGPGSLLAFAQANTIAVFVAGALGVAATALIAGAVLTVGRQA
jgi:membrane-associated phospholipid phosphatase